MSEVTKNNLIKGIAYIAGCAAIGYAIKVTKSAKPLWALLLLSAPNFVTGVSHRDLSPAEAVEAVTDSTDEETDDEEESE